MDYTLTEIGQEFNVKEQEVLFAIIKTAAVSKTPLLLIPKDIFSPILSDDPDVQYEELIQVLVRFMNIPVPLNNKSLPLFDSWSINTNTVSIRFSDELFNNRTEPFSYIMTLYCHPNKKSFILSGNF